FGVLISQEMQYDCILILAGVDVVKTEHRVNVIVPDYLSGVAVHHVYVRALFRHPAIVFYVSFFAEKNVEWVVGLRKLAEHHVIFAGGKAVQITGTIYRYGRYRSLFALRTDRVDDILALCTKLCADIE